LWAVIERPIVLSKMEFIMAKGQQKTNKEAKKLKKDVSPPKPVSSEPVRAAVTTAVIARGKMKNK
jgi:hypothetical protein